MATDTQGVDEIIRMVQVMGVAKEQRVTKGGDVELTLLLPSTKLKERSTRELLAQLMTNML